MCPRSGCRRGAHRARGPTLRPLWTIGPSGPPRRSAAEFPPQGAEIPRVRADRCLKRNMLRHALRVTVSVEELAHGDDQAHSQEAKSLEAALTRIDEAQRLAGPAQSGCGRCGRRRGEDSRQCARAQGDTLTRAAIGVLRSISHGRRTVHSETDDCNDDRGSTGDHAGAGS